MRVYVRERERERERERDKEERVCVFGVTCPPDMFTALMAAGSSKSDREEELTECGRVLVNKGARPNAHDRYDNRHDDDGSLIHSPTHSVIYMSVCVCTNLRFAHLLVCYLGDASS